MLSASMRIQIGMMWPPHNPNTRSTPRALRKRAMTDATQSSESLLTSEHRRLAIRAPEGLQPLDDVAHGGAGGDQLDRHGHDVLLLVAGHGHELLEELIDLALVVFA